MSEGGSADVCTELCFVVWGLRGVRLDFSLFLTALWCCLIISFFRSVELTPVFLVSLLSVSSMYANWQSWKPGNVLAKFQI